MKNCRTVSGLQAAISRGERAQLKVYTTSTANQVLPETWAVNGDSITLNLGGGRFAQVSRREDEFIKGHLNAILC